MKLSHVLFQAPSLDTSCVYSDKTILTPLGGQLSK